MAFGVLLSWLYNPTTCCFWEVFSVKNFGCMLYDNLSRYSYSLFGSRKWESTVSISGRARQCPGCICPLEILIKILGVMGWVPLTWNFEKTILVPLGYVISLMLFCPPSQKPLFWLRCWLGIICAIKDFPFSHYRLTFWACKTLICILMLTKDPKLCSKNYPPKIILLFVLAIYHHWFLMNRCIFVILCTSFLFIFYFFPFLLFWVF